jgi:hypothetical protein
MYVIKAKLYNRNKPETLAVELLFPIKDYTETYRKLSAAGMGDAVKRDCQVTEIDSSYHALNGLCGTEVNVDELDYLAKRLDSFSEPEALQFEGVAAAKGIMAIDDLINLTFSCTQATVISDFSNLNAAGKDHYLNTHGGSAPVSVMDALDGADEARKLIESSAGIVTPFGVVYDNGMTLECYYNGHEFPAYLYDVPVLTLDVTKKSEQGGPFTCLPLPMPDVCLRRALERGGFRGPDDMIIDMTVMSVSSDIFRWIEPLYETPEGMNAAAKVIEGLSDKDVTRLCAAAEYIEPGNASQLRELAERIDDFTFYEDVRTPEEYGRKLITEMGGFLRDADMDDFFDFEGFGNHRLENGRGEFLDEGYIRYDGDAPLEDLFPQARQTPGQGITMGGL